MYRTISRLHQQEIEECDYEKPEMHTGVVKYPSPLTREVTRRIKYIREL